jgi:quinol monooxygenase YgiN
MLLHSVYFWFRPDADAALVARFEAGLARLSKVPEVQAAYIGRPEATPKRAVIDDTYAWALIETFADIEAHDRYQSHPIHQEFVSQFAAIWGKVQVYDVRV